MVAFDLTKDLAEPLATDPDAVFALAASPDGRVLACGGRDMAVRLRDSETGEVRETFWGHVSSVSALAFAPDGSWLVSADELGTLKVWEVPPARLRPRNWKADPATAMAVSPDGRLIASGGLGGKLRVRDSASGKVLWVVAAHPERVLSLAFSPDGKALASVGQSPNPSGPGRVFDPVKLWRADTGAALPGSPTDLPFASAVAFSPDGVWLGVGTREGKVHACRWRGDKRWVPAEGGGGRESVITALTYSPDSRRLSAAGFGGRVEVWDAVKLTSAVVMNPKGAATPGRCGLAFSGDGSVLATVGSDKTLRFWDSATGAAVDAFGGTHPAVLQVASDPRTGEFVRAEADGGLSLWRPGEPKSWVSIGTHLGLDTVALAPETGELFTAGLDGTVRIWPTRPADDPDVLKAATREVEDLAFAPDGRSLAAASMDGKVRVWDLGSRAVARTLEAHAGGATSIAYSPDGRLLATAGMDGTVRLWDARSWAEVGALRGPGKAVWGLAFLPDGRLLASGGSTVSLRDVASGSRHAWPAAEATKIGKDKLDAVEFVTVVDQGIGELVFTRHICLCVGRRLYHLSLDGTKDWIRSDSAEAIIRSFELVK